MKKVIFSLLVFLILLGCQAIMEEDGGTGTGGQIPPLSNVKIESTGEIGQPSQTGPFSVVKVVDGDTIDVDINGTVARVRLIGINTPETVDPRKPVECFGKEASAKAREILGGKKVRLEADPSQTDSDKYARLLRYVFLEDGTNFNKLMISEGYAYEYTYALPYKYQKEFKQAQKTASDAGNGLWAEGACG